MYSKMRISWEVPVNLVCGAVVGLKKKGQWVRNRSSEFLKYDDVVAIEAECPSVELVIPRIPRWGGVLVQTADGSESRTGYNGV